MIDWDPLKTVRHTQSECNAWFDANNKEEILGNTIHHEPVRHTERCMIDGLGARNQLQKVSPLHFELEGNACFNIRRVKFLVPITSI